MGFQNYDTIPTSVIAVASLSVISGIIYVKRRNNKKLDPTKKKVVCITGCDSGLGFSLAQHTVDMGFTVIAGFLSLDSKGCKEIVQRCGKDLIQIQLDLTDTCSVNSAFRTVDDFLKRNAGYSLHAIVNNAGVMVFGEFEWLTEKHIRQQIELNLFGTLNFTNIFCPLVRLHRGRIITVTSHCSQATLPGLAVYGATKAALSAFSDGLRVEMNKYGVDVVTFIPGSFVVQSSIMAKQLQNVKEMHDKFSTEQHSFYNDYFNRYNGYLSCITGPPQPVKIDDKRLYAQYEKTLLDKKPNVVYKNEDFKYWFYYNLFKVSPWFLRDHFITKFMAMPNYMSNESNNSTDS